MVYLYSKWNQSWIQKTETRIEYLESKLIYDFENNPYKNISHKTSKKVHKKMVKYFQEMKHEV
jgi:ribosome-associated toxin RatA of RatAB toxin-antitoxin module